MNHPGIPDIGEQKWSSKTLMDNWYEDKCLKEDLIKDFLEKKDRGELMVQRLGKLKAKMESHANLTPVGDGILRFGHVVQLMNPGADPNMVRLQRTSSRNPTMMSIISTDAQMFTLSDLPPNSNVSGSFSLEPMLRNVFRVTSCDGSKDGTPVLYGHPFELLSHEALGRPLYLTSDRSTFHRSAKLSRHQEVFFHDESCQLTKWMVEYFHPQMRLEFHGSPVPMKEKVIIKHVNTNQALTLEIDFTHRGIFGREYEVSTHTYLDDHKAERDVNHWVFTPKQMIGGNLDIPEPNPEETEFIIKGTPNETSE